LIVFVHRNNVIPLAALENHVFPLFRPYSALIRRNTGQIGVESLTFRETFQLRLEISLTDSIFHIETM